MKKYKYQRDILHKYFNTSDLFPKVDEVFTQIREEKIDQFADMR